MAFKNTLAFDMIAKLMHLYKTRLKRLASQKHSSLFNRYEINMKQVSKQSRLSLDEAISLQRLASEEHSSLSTLLVILDKAN